MHEKLTVLHITIYKIQNYNEMVNHKMTLPNEDKLNFGWNLSKAFLTLKRRVIIIVLKNL